jgi:hypothetical protein
MSNHFTGEGKYRREIGGVRINFLGGGDIETFGTKLILQLV